MKLGAVRPVQPHRCHAAENKGIAEDLVRRGVILRFVADQHEVGGQVIRKLIVNEVGPKRIDGRADADRGSDEDEAMAVPVDVDARCV